MLAELEPSKRAKSRSSPITTIKSVFPNVTSPTNRESPREDVILKLRADLKEASGDKPRDGEKASRSSTSWRISPWTYMTKIANDAQYHPAARVNAMLAIGEVNSPKAAKVLLNTAFGKGQVFALRVAAMTGLVRMAGPSGKKVLSDPEIEPLIVDKLVRSPSSTRRRKTTASPGCGGRQPTCSPTWEMSEHGVPAALLTMLGDKDLPIPLRSKAARALGKLNYGEQPARGGPVPDGARGFRRRRTGQRSACQSRAGPARRPRRVGGAEAVRLVKPSPTTRL